MGVTRRDVVKISVLSGAAVGLPVSHALGDSVSGNRIAESRLPRPFTRPFTRPTVAVPVRTDPLTGTQIYRIEMRPFRAEIVPGLVTDLWGYNGVYPGPTIVVDRNTPTRVRQINNLPRVHPTLGFTPWTSVHLHGHASLPQYDGYAGDISNPGQYKDYEYHNRQEARTLWYHDHGVHHTAETVQMGLAAFYLLHDDHELGLPIPHGEFDVPLMFADISFNADGSVLFDNNDNKGLYGDVILVNGQPWPVMPVKRRKYRFRFLNACPARSFKWSLDTGGTMTIIGTDAGLAPRPVPVRSFRHGVAERYEVVIDFAQYQAGQRITLRNAAPKNTISFTNTDKALQFLVTDEPFDGADNEIPDQLNPNQPTMLLKESDATITRRMDFVRQNGLWTINGVTWDDIVASRFLKVAARTPLGAVEIWELRNTSGGWHHPAHIHLVDFKITSRNGQPAMPFEAGPKDVVYLGENESVRLLIRFDEGTGRYMEHCHNLTHEDHDMMTQFEVVGPVPAPDPLGTRAIDLPERTSL